MDTPTDTEAAAKTPPGRGWVRLGFAVLVALAVAALVCATIAAHLLDRLIEWSWAVS